MGSVGGNRFIVSRRNIILWHIIYYLVYIAVTFVTCNFRHVISTTFFGKIGVGFKEELEEG